MSRRYVERNGRDRALLEALEARLAGTLRPVTPPREVVNRLRRRIRFPERRALARRLSDWEFAFFVVGSVMSVAVLIAAVARALFHLFGRRG